MKCIMCIAGPADQKGLSVYSRVQNAKEAVTVLEGNALCSIHLSARRALYEGVSFIGEES